VSARLIGYVRVSTEEQGESGAGLDAQRSAIERECAERGDVLVGIETDVQSGRTMRRPGLKRALEQLATGELDGLVVAKVDRLSRSLLDFSGLVETARKQGWNLVVLDLGVDLSTPNGELLANLLATFAQFERRMAGDRTREALAARRAAGVRLGRPPIVGAALRTRIHRLRRQGVSFRGICSKLTEDGISPPSGAAWYPTTIRRILAVDQG
jgi:DNA invertase Pin-like site-specific DNA recombinase